ncbi:MAG: PQQ-dependent sugar dehydrogenase, partial [Arenicella sp.]|nr:PQQ-dependent sugar dehydrogenase [Arenicella sp.]
MLKTLIIAASILVSSAAVAEDTELPFKVTPVATFNEPWAMTFMPDGKMLVTEKRGRLYIVTQDGEVGPYFDEVPNVDYRGQGGLGDVIVHPEFEKNQLVYLSYAESGMGNTRGAAVARGRIQVPDRGRPYLTDVEVIWRQIPKMTDDGHYGHRMAFDKDGYLFISSGDRQKFDPAQHMTGTVGKIVRLHDDGSVPDDNPFAEDGD